MLILASTSAIRRTMLEQAGIDFKAISPDLDEASEKVARSDPGSLARALAEAKALAVSASEPADWVVGSDSVASVEGKLFDKAADRDEAARHLRHFSGKELVLTSAVALARRGKIDWSVVDSSRLRVRPLSDGFIDAYLDLEWPEVGYCVGVFRMEGRGVQLFESIEGNYFTILGMPLIPLLGALRERALVPA